ncbi:MAG: ATP cone domain-containing protein, partial [bacterium]|nr:ATP cone domain-containing protein [bacterium]
MLTDDIFVIKSDGSRERFSFEKLERSLRHAGASEALAKEVSVHVQNEAVGNMSTYDIYRHAFEVLRKQSHQTATRYSLRRALLALGPTGFPFERFIGEILKRRGYQVLIGQIIRGHCAEHEVDVVAWNAQKLVMAEAKFHHELGYKSDLKVALYVKARFDDLQKGVYSFGGRKKLDEGWLITNTKFTERAISYSECAGVHLLGWNYPRTENLHHLIEETGLHPITSLTSLSEKEKQLLLAQGIVLCDNIRTETDKIRSLGFSKEVLERAISESNILCP